MIPITKIWLIKVQIMTVIITVLIDTNNDNNEVDNGATPQSFRFIIS